MAKDTTRSSRFSQKRGTQIGLDSYSKGQELPTQRILHAGLVSIGRSRSQFVRKRYDVVPADATNNIPHESFRVINFHESAWDDTTFDAYGYNPFHSARNNEVFIASILDNVKDGTVFRSEAVFDPVFYKHYKDHHDRESVYLEKEDVSMSAFNVLDFMSGSKYFDLPFDENIYSHRMGIQKEWMLELLAKQTFNLRQEHPMSAATGIQRKFVRTDYSGEIRNSNIRELYFEDWPVLISFELTGSRVDADYVRAAESVLNEEIFFEENDININPLIDDPINIPNAHDPEIMNQLYTFRGEFDHSSNPTPIYFVKNSEGIFELALLNAANASKSDLGKFDSSIIIDQSHVSNHGRPLTLFLNDGTYYDTKTVPSNHAATADSVLNYTGTFSVGYEINGSSVTRSSYFASVKAGTYSKAQIKLDASFSGDLIIFVDKDVNRQHRLEIEPYYVSRGLPGEAPLTPFNLYNKKNHINGHSGHIAEPSQRYDSIAFRGLKR